MDKTVVVIPARMASSRLPGKPLADICGLPMVEHVRRRAEMANPHEIDAVIVATCDQEIADVIAEYGGSAVMTSNKHETCIDRVAEAVINLDVSYKNIIIVQGDEPLVYPPSIEGVRQCMDSPHYSPCVNLVERIGTEDFFNPDIVKVVRNGKSDIIYFSREPVPHGGGKLAHRQVGVIGFERQHLMKFVRASQRELEKAEGIDMLRAIEYGWRVKGVEFLYDYRTVGVDTKKDLELARKLMEKDYIFNQYYRGEADSYPPDSFSSKTPYCLHTLRPR